MVLHSDVAEAAVVGYPHDIKGQGIYAYVTLMSGVEANETLRKELIAFVGKISVHLPNLKLYNLLQAYQKLDLGKL